MYNDVHHLHPVASDSKASLFSPPGPSAQQAWHGGSLQATRGLQDPSKRPCCSLSAKAFDQLCPPNPPRATREASSDARRTSWTGTGTTPAPSQTRGVLTPRDTQWAPESLTSSLAPLLLERQLEDLVRVLMLLLGRMEHTCHRGRGGLVG